MIENRNIAGLTPFFPKHTDPDGLFPFAYPLSARNTAIILGNRNPWLGGELGGNVHLIYAGLGLAVGVEINPLTGQVCFFSKANGRIGLGAFAGAGVKATGETGPYSKKTGPSDYEEIGVDAAIKAGGKYSFKPAWLPTSGNASKNGLGIGVGPNLGYGLAAGYDWGRKRSWCINAPDEQNCNER